MSKKIKISDKFIGGGSPVLIQSMCNTRTYDVKATTEQILELEKAGCDTVYSRNFTTNEINESLKDYRDKNLEPYDISTKSNYYYMIRETGGIITGAYVDDRNSVIISVTYFENRRER